MKYAESNSKKITPQSRWNLWISVVKAFFFWSSPHIPQIVLRRILIFYGCPVFRSHKPNQNVYASQNFTNMIFLISLGRFERKVENHCSKPLKSRTARLGTGTDITTFWHVFEILIFHVYCVMFWYFLWPRTFLNRLNQTPLILKLKHDWINSLAYISINTYSSY